MDEATLTIEPGVEIVGNDLIRVEDGATLRAEGEDTRPIWFHGEPREMGSWSGIRLEEGGTALLDRVAVHDAGGGEGAAIEAQSDSAISLTNSVVRRTAGTGVTIDKSASISAFSNNEFYGNESEPVRVKPNHVSALDSETINRGNNGTDAIYVENGTLTADATWAAAGVPYRVGVFTVEAALSLDPGAAVTSRGATILVRNGGSLTAEGENDAPIRFEGVTDQQGFWAGIVARDQTTVTLDNAVVAHGGKYEPANLTLRGESSATVTNCTIRDAAGYGINVAAGASLTASANTFENNAEGAIAGEGYDG